MPRTTTNEAAVLYGEQTRLTLENMSFSGVPLSRFPEYIRQGALVKKACALANRRAGLLDPGKAGRIMSACDELATGRYDGQFPVDAYHGGGGIGINMNLNEVLATLAGGGIDPIDDVNMSQSTSDVCHTALRLALYERLGALDGEVADWIAVVDDLARRFGPIPTVARTCLQDGMKVSCGAVFSGLAGALLRLHRDCAAARQAMTRVNLGWTVIGTGTGAPLAYREAILPALHEVTGVAVCWHDNLLDASQYPDDVAAVSGVVLRLGHVLAKFARDLRLLSSGPETGLHELSLPAAQAGSSFFPGKVNPVIPEMMIQCSMLMDAHDGVIQRCVGLGEIHINLWEEMMGFLLLENVDMLVRAMHCLLHRCVAGITVNEAVCRRYATSKIPLVTEAKERYGYRHLADRIKAEGLDAVVASLKATVPAPGTRN